jgi:hypothetical protein
LRKILFSLFLLPIPSKRIVPFLYALIGIGDAHSTLNLRKTQNLKKPRLGTHPYQNLKIFFRSTSGEPTFATRIFGMLIFKKRIYPEQISREPTFVARIFMELICEVSVSPTPNWLGLIFHKPILFGPISSKPIFKEPISRMRHSVAQHLFGHKSGGGIFFPRIALGLIFEKPT